MIAVLRNVTRRWDRQHQYLSSKLHKIGAFVLNLALRWLETDSST